MKEGKFGDLWKCNIDYLLKTELTSSPHMPSESIEIEGASWQKIDIQGDYPKRISHHSGLLQEGLCKFLIYGGITDSDSSDELYVLDLNTFSFERIKAS